MAQSPQPLVDSNTAIIGLDPNQRKQKLSLYSPSAPVITLERVESPFQAQIGVLRQHITQQLHIGSGYSGEVVGKVILWEKSVHDGLNVIIDDNEKLNPNLLYVGMAGLGGRIITRNRNFLFRTLAPPTLLLFALQYFLPHTYSNLSLFASEAEQRQFPALHKTHQRINSEASHRVTQGITAVTAVGSAIWGLFPFA